MKIWLKFVYCFSNSQKSPPPLQIPGYAPDCRQARSQDLEKGGGAILKEWEVCKRPWPKFSLLLNQFHTVGTKIETKFLGNLGNSKLFSAQNQMVSKKKKRSSPILRLNFWPKSQIQSFFLPKIRWFPKKKNKKKVFTDFETEFSAEISNSKLVFAQNQVVSKNIKKKVFADFETDCSDQLGNPNVWGGGCFPMGGLFSIFY